MNRSAAFALTAMLSMAAAVACGADESSVPTPEQAAAQRDFQGPLSPCATLEEPTLILDLPSRELPLQTEVLRGHIFHRTNQRILGMTPSGSDMVSRVLVDYGGDQGEFAEPWLPFVVDDDGLFYTQGPSVKGLPQLMRMTWNAITGDSGDGPAQVDIRSDERFALLGSDGNDLLVVDLSRSPRPVGRLPKSGGSISWVQTDADEIGWVDGVWWWSTPPPRGTLHRSRGALPDMQGSPAIASTCPFFLSRDALHCEGSYPMRRFAPDGIQLPDVDISSDFRKGDDRYHDPHVVFADDRKVIVVQHKIRLSAHDALMSFDSTSLETRLLACRLGIGARAFGGDQTQLVWFESNSKHHGLVRLLH